MRHTCRTLSKLVYPPVLTRLNFSHALNISHPHSWYMGSPVTLHMTNKLSVDSGRSRLWAS